MVGIIERIEQIFVKRMNVLQAGKALENRLKFFAEGFGGKPDFSSVKSWIQMSASRLLHCQNIYSPLILLILNPARICVGNLRWVRLKTISMNS